LSAPQGGLEPVTLYEASADKGRGIVALSYDALRKAAEPDRAKGEFPPRLGQRATGGYLYNPVDLQRWEVNRPMPKAIGLGTDGVGTDRVGRENESSAEADPQGVYPQGPASRRDNDRDRFRAKVAERNEDGCALWTGALDKDGYPIFSVTVDGVERTVRAHRWAYEDEIGPIPEGLTLDHTCETPACVWTGHLEPVTAIENLRRRHARQRAQQGATS
jgi:HNH endonuclease